MKLCKKQLHYYSTRQCNPCKKIWHNQNKTIVYAANKAWRDRNKDTYVRVQNKEVARAYRQANKAKRTACQIKREKAKIQRVPKWLTELHFQQIQIFYDSAHALTKEFGIQMDVDHIVPLQGKNVSGLHVPWNLQVIPHSVNMSKGNR